MSNNLKPLTKRINNHIDSKLCIMAMMEVTTPMTPAKRFDSLFFQKCKLTKQSKKHLIKSKE